MKKLVTLILLITTILSCKKETTPTKDYLVISGTIENFKKRNVTLKGFRFEKKIKFNKKTKTFVDTLKIDRDGYYSIIFNKKKFDVYLSKTDDLNIKFDYNTPELITFEGNNAAINQYFIKKSKVFAEEIGKLASLYTIDEFSFLVKLNTYRDSLINLSKSSDLPENFLKIEKQNIEYEYLRDINYYPIHYPSLSGDKEYVASDIIATAIDTINYNNRLAYLNSSFYRTIIKDELEKKARKKQAEGIDLPLTNIETVYTEVTDTIIKNDLLFHVFAKKGITYTDNLNEYYKKFLAFSTNKEHKKEITEIYDSFKLTAKGKPCPKFVNYENNNGESTSLDDLLGNGKYLYIDVWATWCAFCQRETPLLKRFELQYHDQNIEFVSISVDVENNKEKWKKTIEQKEMGGVQLFADKSFDSDFIKKFAIKGLPRFILVDPEGNIISRNAPRPSDGKRLTNLLEEIGAIVP